MARTDGGEAGISGSSGWMRTSRDSLEFGHAVGDRGARPGDRGGSASARRVPLSQDLPSLPALPFLVRRAGARGADEQLLPVREGDVAAVGAQRTVLRLEAVDDDLDAHGQRVLAPAAADQRVRRATFDRPPLHLPVRARDVDVDPGVRVGPLHFEDRAVDLDGLVRVELGRERVVSDGRGGRSNEQRGTGDDGEQFRTHRVSPVLLWRYRRNSMPLLEPTQASFSGRRRAAPPRIRRTYTRAAGRSAPAAGRAACGSSRAG